jgi:peptidoglycan/LPS O-acetylase OafA/YrhL
MDDQKHIYNFDLLRGAAALGVAIPHFFLAKEANAVLEGISVIAVELFFVLSGFVLAPQLIKIHEQPTLDNIRVFYLRRWLRTVVPYFLALSLMAVPIATFGSLDFLRKLFFLDTLLGPHDPDFYPISWSLAVEEWYYLLAAMCVFLFHKIALTRIILTFIAVFALIKVAAVAAGPEWVENIRRGAIFRLDAIAFGFLLFQLRNTALTTINVALLTMGGGLMTIVLTMLGMQLFSNLAVLEIVLVYGFSAFSLGVVSLAYSTEPTVRSRSLVAAATFAGAISYPVYLFHLHIAYALQLIPMALWAAFAIFLAAVVGFAWLFHNEVERVVMLRRPKYSHRQPTLRPAREAARAGRAALMSIAILFAGVAAAEFCAKYYLDRRAAYAVSPMFYQPPSKSPLPTKNIFDAVDPQLGYAHPRGSIIDLKSWGTAYEPGFGVHRPKQGNFASIYVLGGSTSDPYLAINKGHHPWTYHLHNECRRNGFNCGIWNGGIGGFGTPQEIIKMVRDVMPSKPEIIIGLHGPNELNRNNRAPYTMGFQKEQMARLANDGSLWMGGYFPNVLTALSIIKTGDDRPSQHQEIFYGTEPEQDPYERWAANVAMMNGIAESQGAVYRTVLQPIVGYGAYEVEPELLSERTDDYFELVRSFYGRATAFCRTVEYCIDLSGLFDGKTGLFDDARHPNDKGNRIIAVALGLRLQEQGVLANAIR